MRAQVLAVLDKAKAHPTSALEHDNGVVPLLEAYFTMGKSPCLWIFWDCYTDEKRCDCMAEIVVKG
ncbi:hypothetical protein RFF05_06250 [Bengtsoniella intestinalis]|uniref:hypothetical protein n=1 Tax=Bengtsoniella intestinalis TaxID=3073143 RepID=UPI00391F6F83